MDRRVKERLVGASILLLLIVLIVPELLSGPAPLAPLAPQLPVVNTPKPVRHVTVDLATSKPMEAAAAGESDEAPASSAPTPVQPPAAQSAAAEEAPAESAPAAPLEGAAVPPISTASAKAAAAARGWSVQIGSFASRANADKLVRQLKAQGFAVFDSASGTGSAARYRVRVGPVADRSAALQVAAKLKGVGHSGSLVPP